MKKIGNKTYYKILIAAMIASMLLGFYLIGASLYYLPKDANSDIFTVIAFIGIGGMITALTGILFYISAELLVLPDRIADRLRDSTPDHK